MKKLLSLPPNLVGWFHDITGYPKSEWFCTNDPIDHKLGSGGGTTWLLTQAYENEMAHSDANNQKTFDEWLSSEKRLLLHAGGQSRRLPAYAPSGKVLPNLFFAEIGRISALGNKECHFSTISPNFFGSL